MCVQRNLQEFGIAQRGEHNTHRRTTLSATRLAAQERPSAASYAAGISHYSPSRKVIAHARTTMLIRPHTVHPSASADRRQLAVQCSGTLADRGARLHNNPPVRQTNQHADHALGWRSDFTEQYVRGIQIGKGAYGSVYEATPLRHVGGEAEPVAVKILSKQDGSAKVLRRLTREADALEALTHVPGVVHLHGKYEGPTYAMLVTQLLAGCDLLALRKALGGRLKELQLAFVARQMLTVLAGVHEAGWCHGDCKPSNWIARAGLKKRLVLLEQGKLDAAAYQVCVVVDQPSVRCVHDVTRCIPHPGAVGVCHRFWQCKPATQCPNSTPTQAHRHTCLPST